MYSTWVRVSTVACIGSRCIEMLIVYTFRQQVLTLYVICDNLSYVGRAIWDHKNGNTFLFH
jgi:hypothetical protein